MQQLTDGEHVGILALGRRHQVQNVVLNLSRLLANDQRALLILKCCGEAKGSAIRFFVDEYCHRER